MGSGQDGHVGPSLEQDGDFGSSLGQDRNVSPSLGHGRLVVFFLTMFKASLLVQFSPSCLSFPHC